MRKYLDLLLAGAVFILAASISMVAYFRVLGVEQYADESSPGVPLGLATFKAYQGDECFGSVTTDVKTDPGDVLIANGKLRMQIQGQRVAATVFVGAYFNPFGQLVSGDLKISTPQASLLVQAKNPNPIRLTVTFTGPQGRNERTFELPGPILSQHTPDKELRVKYHLWETNSRTMMAGVAQGIALGSLTQLNLHLEKAAAVGDACDPSNDAGPALQVDSLLQLLKSQQERLREIMPGMLGTF